LIDFGADWCKPCEKLKPIVDEIANEYLGRAIVGTVDVGTNPETAVKYGVRNLPTILFLKNGEVVDKQVGLVPKANLVAMLNKHL